MNFKERSKKQIIQCTLRGVSGVETEWMEFEGKNVEEICEHGIAGFDE